MARSGGIARTVSRAPSVGRSVEGGGGRGFATFKFAESAGLRTPLISGIGATRVPGIEGRLAVPRRPISLPGNSSTNDGPSALSINRNRVENISVIPPRPQAASGAEFIMGLGEFNPNNFQSRNNTVELMPGSDPKPSANNSAKAAERGFLIPTLTDLTVRAERSARRSLQENVRGIATNSVRILPDIKNNSPLEPIHETPINPTRLAPEIISQQEPRHIITNETTPAQRRTEVVKQNVTIPLVVLERKAVPIAQRKTEIAAELAVIDAKNLTEVNPVGRTADTNVFPLAQPGVSQSTHVENEISEKPQNNATQIGVSKNTIHDADAYVALLEERERKREKAGKARFLQMQRLERVRVYQEKLTEPVQDPFLEPVKFSQQKTDVTAQQLKLVKTDVISDRTTQARINKAHLAQQPRPPLSLVTSEFVSTEQEPQRENGAVFLRKKTGNNPEDPEKMPQGRYIVHKQTMLERVNKIVKGIFYAKATPEGLVQGNDVLQATDTSSENLKSPLVRGTPLPDGSLVMIWKHIVVLGLSTRKEMVGAINWINWRFRAVAFRDQSNKADPEANATDVFLVLSNIDSQEAVAA